MRLRAHRRRDSEHDNADRWLLTYSDMITLLLALFIVMYSMSKIDAGRFDQVAQALAGQLKGGYTIFEKSLLGPSAQSGMLNLKQLELLERRILNAALIENRRRRESSAGDSETLGISAQIDQRGLVVHVKESALFDPGKSELKEKAYEALDLIGRQLTGITNPVRIEGHTDNVPISTARFPSNWELSAARATTVVKYFVSAHDVPPTRLSALGYGEFRPISSNATPDGRSQNRRVDIVVLSTSELAMEPPDTGVAPPPRKTLTELGHELQSVLGNSPD